MPSVKVDVPVRVGATEIAVSTVVYVSVTAIETRDLVAELRRRRGDRPPLLSELREEVREAIKVLEEDDRDLALVILQDALQPNAARSRRHAQLAAYQQIMALRPDA